MDARADLEHTRADLAHRQDVHDRDVTELRAAYTATVHTVTADRDRERADHEALVEGLGATHAAALTCMHVERDRERADHEALVSELRARLSDAHDRAGPSADPPPDPPGP